MGDPFWAEDPGIEPVGGPERLGSDLRGVTARFARDDLFTAILQPSRDVSSRYRTALVETADGLVYQGMVVYEAADSLMLQTGATSTVRLAGDQIVGPPPVLAWIGVCAINQVTPQYLTTASEWLENDFDRTSGASR